MYKVFIFLTIFIIFLSSCGKKINSNSSTEKHYQKQELVVSTFNLYDLKNKNAYKNLALFIKKYNIDIMLVQEIQVDDKKDILSALEKLNLKRYINFSKSNKYSYNGSEGEDYLAIISKYPIKDIESILLKKSKDPISNKSYYSPRPVLKAKINVFNKDITFFNIHLKAQSPWRNCSNCIQKRRASANLLSKYILKNYNPEKEFIVIAGDANTATPDQKADFEKGSTLDILTLKTDNNPKNDFIAVNYTYKKEGTHTKHKGSLMDHILLSPFLFKNYVKNSVDIITPEGKPSDHKSVILKLDFNKK